MLDGAGPEEEEEATTTREDAGAEETWTPDEETPSPDVAVEVPTGVNEEDAEAEVPASVNEEDAATEDDGPPARELLLVLTSSREGSPPPVTGQPASSKQAINVQRMGFMLPSGGAWAMPH